MAERDGVKADPEAKGGAGIGVSGVRKVTKRRSRIPWGASLSLLIFVGFAAACIIVPAVVDIDVRDTNLRYSLEPPVWAGGSWSDPLGTDRLGRDLLDRILVAGRASLVLGITAVGIGATFGVTVGLTGAYLGGKVDSLISRLMDAQLALPFVVVALSLTLAVGPSYTASLAATVTALWVPIGRISRTQCMVIRESDYVALARVAGLRGGKIVFRHVLPNVFPAIFVMLPLEFGRALIFESSLSFIGLGAQPPAASLGLMISEGRDLILTNPGLSLIPAMVLAGLVLSIMVVANWVRKRIDPTLAMAK